MVNVHRRHSAGWRDRAKNWRRFEGCVTPSPADADSPSGRMDHAGQGPPLQRGVSETSMCESLYESVAGDGVESQTPSGMPVHYTGTGSVEDLFGSMVAHPVDTELRRRKLYLLFYLLRSPVFDR